MRVKDLPRPQVMKLMVGPRGWATPRKGSANGWIHPQRDDVYGFWPPVSFGFP